MYSHLTSAHVRRARTLVVTLCVFVFALVLSGAGPSQKIISIYSRAASYSLPVVDVNGQEYAGLLEVLEPLGSVTARTDSRRWKLRYENVELQFSPEDARVRIKGGDFNLGAPFEMQNGRGLVPVSSLSPLLSRILGGPVSFSANSRRILIGNVAVHFTAQMSATTPPGLVMNFTAPVNPTIATEPGKLRMTFSHEPVVPSGTQTLTFNDKLISSATYQDGNGAADISILAAVPLFASFSNDRRTITIAPAPAPSTPAAQVQTPELQKPQQTPLAPVPPATSALRPQYFAVIDAGHGGDDRGAALSDQLSEKDVTLAFAFRLREELEAKGISVLMVRTNDSTVSLDERAAVANASHARIYICLHASSEGNGVRLYTALLSGGGESHGVFLDWDTAQSASLSQSSDVAEILAKSFASAKIPVRRLAAPLRPLNNITTPAVALEIGSRVAGQGELSSPEFQQLIAKTIAGGLDGARRQLETEP